jgi:hypothetical protein
MEPNQMIKWGQMMLSNATCNLVRGGCIQKVLKAPAVCPSERTQQLVTDWSLRNRYDLGLVAIHTIEGSKRSKERVRPNHF